MTSVRTKLTMDNCSLITTELHQPILALSSPLSPGGGEGVGWVSLHIAWQAGRGLYPFTWGKRFLEYSYLKQVTPLLTLVTIPPIHCPTAGHLSALWSVSLSLFFLTIMLLHRVEVEAAAVDGLSYLEEKSVMAKANLF